MTMGPSYFPLVDGPRMVSGYPHNHSTYSGTPQAPDIVFHDVANNGIATARRYDITWVESQKRSGQN